MTEHRAQHPFVRESYSVYDVDGMTEVMGWRPGTIRGADILDNGAYAHGVGEVIYTEVARFKPGRYPERVFYVRQFITPAGERFGLTKLRVTTVSAFNRMVKGYSYAYDVVDP